MKELSFCQACAIGDGYLSKLSGNTCSIVMSHSIKQRDYLCWKIDCINQELNTKGTCREYSVFNHQVQKSYQTCRASASSRLLVPIREELYPDGTKRITKEYLDQLGLEALAVFWMDDGCINKTRNDANIATCTKTREESEVIANWISELTGIDLRITCRKQTYYLLEIKRSEMPKFLSCIKPYMHSSMAYKANLSFKPDSKSYESYLETLEIPFIDQVKEARAQDSLLLAS